MTDKRTVRKLGQKHKTHVSWTRTHWIAPRCRVCLQTKTPSRTEQDASLFFAPVSTEEHFPQHRLCCGDAANHGQQACPDTANRCLATSAAGGRLPRLQLPTAGGGRQLMVVSNRIKDMFSGVVTDKRWMNYDLCLVVKL